MRSKEKFTVGSRAFFDGIDGFNPSDTDILYVMTDVNVKNFKCISFKEGEFDRILIIDMSKDELIEHIKESDTICASKILVPSVAEYFGVTINDLPQLTNIFNALDEKHQYQKIIFNAYIENGKFEMTDEQRNLAFEEYKKYRNPKSL